MHRGVSLWGSIAHIVFLSPLSRALAMCHHMGTQESRRELMSHDRWHAAVYLVLRRGQINISGFARILAWGTHHERLINVAGSSDRSARTIPCFGRSTLSTEIPVDAADFQSHYSASHSTIKKLCLHLWTSILFKSENRNRMFGKKARKAFGWKASRRPFTKTINMRRFSFLRRRPPPLKGSGDATSIF